MALELLKIGFNCINYDRRKRPSARELSKKLKSFLTRMVEGNLYIKRCLI